MGIGNIQLVLPKPNLNFWLAEIITVGVFAVFSTFNLIFVATTVAQILLNDGHKSELGHHESNAQPCMIFTTLCLVVGYFRFCIRDPTFPFFNKNLPFGNEV